MPALALSRSAGEAVVIVLPDGREVVVTFLGPRAGHKDQARVGVLAPRDAPIRRDDAKKAPSPGGRP